MITRDEQELMAIVGIQRSEEWPAVRKVIENHIESNVKLMISELNEEKMRRYQGIILGLKSLLQNFDDAKENLNLMR